ncbi:MAG: hypothetical protein M3P06_05155 [Acidobacteriota bacterium]|nr:hypothetical protein [Acidobacteriota bacterium]
MVNSDAETPKARENRDSYARLEGLLGAPRDKRSGEWQSEVKLAFRSYLRDEKAQPHLIFPLVELLPTEIAIAEVGAEWEQIPIATQEKIIRGLTQKASQVAVAVGLADGFARSSKSSDAVDLVSAALFALKRPPGPETRAWVEKGGLNTLLSLLVQLRGQLGDTAEHAGLLLGIAEAMLKESSKKTTRPHISTFLAHLKTLIEGGDVNGDATAVLSSRISALERLEEPQPKSKNKPEQKRRAVGVASDASGHSSPSSEGTGGKNVDLRPGPAASPSNPRLSMDWSDPRVVIGAVSSVVTLLEELELRRGQQAGLDRVESEKLATQNEMALLREHLMREEEIVASLKTRVAELEESLRGVKIERDKATRQREEVEEMLKKSDLKIAELHKEQTRLFDELPKQRLAEFRNNVRSRLRPILDEIAEFHTHPNLPHETAALLDRCRALKEILVEEQIVRG